MIVRGNSRPVLGVVPGAMNPSFKTVFASLVATLLAYALLSAAGPPTGVATAEWSYRDLDAVLERHVTADGRVDYPGLVRDRAPLDRFVELLGAVSPESRPESFPGQEHRLAYWMNAYNALMLRRVVEAWPTTSVKKIRVAYGVFWLEKHRLGGRKMTLRSLENDIIRSFGDPRIHFAINCASTGCPALPQAGWKPETLERDLEQAARRFINDPAKVRWDPNEGVLYLSKIFKWFEDDFVVDGHGVTDYVRRYLEGIGTGEPRIEWLEYDWSINAAN